MISTLILAIGSLASDFSGYDQNNNLLQLSNLKNKFIVLFFYPKDKSPGCSIQVKKYQELINEFQKYDTKIIGISFDDIKTHQEFAEAKNLTFSLISDETKQIAINYGSYSNADFFKIPSRDTIIIDQNKKIVDIRRSVSVFSDAQDALNKIIQLSKQQ